MIQASVADFNFFCLIGILLVDMIQEESCLTVVMQDQSGTQEKEALRSALFRIPLHHLYPTSLFFNQEKPSSKKTNRPLRSHKP